MVTIKKTTVVVTTTKTTSMDGKSTTTTETVTTSSDGDAADAKAMEEVADALSPAFDSLDEHLRAAFSPFDSIFKKKQAPEKKGV